jgi:CheY-like chemotaxis protein
LGAGQGCGGVAQDHGAADAAGRDQRAGAILTANARAEDRVKPITAGFQFHVTKPVELVAMVASAAERIGR